MKKTLAALAAALMMFGLFGVVSATADPGPNGNNDKGLCTAYFNGQKNGHDKDGDGNSNPGPFRALEDAADEDDGEDADSGDALEVAADVFEFCQGLIGGNTEHGRYSCEQTEGADTPDDPSDDTFACSQNDAPGNS